MLLQTFVTALVLLLPLLARAIPSQELGLELGFDDPRAKGGSWLIYVRWSLSRAVSCIDLQ